MLLHGQFAQYKYLNTNELYIVDTVFSLVKKEGAWSEKVDGRANNRGSNIRQSRSPEFKMKVAKDYERYIHRQQE